MLKRRITGKRDFVYTAPVEESNTDVSEGNVMLHRVVQGTPFVILKSCSEKYMSSILSSNHFRTLSLRTARNQSHNIEDEEQAPLKGEFETKSEAAVGMSSVETGTHAKSVVEVPPEQPDLTLWSAIRTANFW